MNKPSNQPRYETKTVNGGVAVFDRHTFTNVAHARGLPVLATEQEAVRRARHVTRAFIAAKAVLLNA